FSPNLFNNRRDSWQTDVTVPLYADERPAKGKEQDDGRTASGLGSPSLEAPALAGPAVASRVVTNSTSRLTTSAVRSQKQSAHQVITELLDTEKNYTNEIKILIDVSGGFHLGIHRCWLLFWARVLSSLVNPSSISWFRANKRTSSTQKMS